MKAHDANLRIKIYSLLGFFVALTVALVFGGIWHQVLHRDQYLSWARKQQLMPVRLIPLRGKILDRRGSPLAVSLKVGSVFAHPASVLDPKETARVLGPILDMDPGILHAKLSKDLSFVWLARQLPLNRVESIRELGISGIGMEKEGKRYYPNRELAGHVIGFTGMDFRGLEGLEWAFEDLLPGKGGQLLLQRDARGKVLWQGVSGKPDKESGCDLRLTLDLRIQHIAEQALRGAVKKSQAKAGMVVALDPRSGEVLAMACMPSFNPNNYRNSSPAQWRNRTITDSFEPGSTAKAFLLAAALEEELVDEELQVNCEEGRFRYGGHWIHDISKKQLLSVREIIVHSSNIGVAKIADSLGKQNLWNHLSSLGFGRKTGFDLPGEATGSLRDWNRWAKVSLATHAYGQGFSVTTLQLARAFCVLANHGFLIEPYLVQEVWDSEGRLVMERHPRVARRVISRKTADRVINVLEAVVAEGTGKRGGVPGFRTAGKTGTAQKFDKSSGKYSSEKLVVSFVGIVPVDRPEMVIAVVLDEPQGDASGGMLAAPVFREIASRSLHLLRVPGEIQVMSKTETPVRFCSRTMADENGPARVSGASAGDHRAKGQRLMPALENLPLRSALRELEGLPVTIRLHGSGRIVYQDPQPGSLLKAGQTLWLRAAHNEEGEPG